MILFLIPCSNVSDFQETPVPVGDAYQFLQFAKMRDELARFANLSEQYLQENVKKLKNSQVILEEATVEFMEEFLSDEYLATAKEELEVRYICSRPTCKGSQL